MEDVHAQPLGDTPGPSGVGKRGHALIQHAGRRVRQRPIHDVGVSRDPADVCHAPIDVLGMNVENPFRRGGDVGQVPGDAVLHALGLARGPARVHQEQGSFRRQGDGLDLLSLVLLEEVVHEGIAARDHGRLGGILSGIPLPHQDLIDVLPQLFRRPHRDVGIRLVIHERAVSPIAVHRDQHAAAGILNARAARLTAEPAKDL